MLRNFSTGYSILSTRNVGISILFILNLALGVRIGNESGKLSPEEGEGSIAAIFWTSSTVHLMAMEIYLTLTSTKERLKKE
jgi:hypothetical protein